MRKTTSFSVRHVFKNYLLQQKPPQIIVEILTTFIYGEFSRAAVNEVCREFKLQDLNEIKPELLDLVLYYTSCCLEEHAITEEEKIELKFLKILFQIKEGDLFEYKSNQIRQIISIEAKRILADWKVDETESLYQVDLQQIFDLSYDQYLSITRPLIKEIVDQIIESLTGNSSISDNELKQLNTYLVNLDTFYVLNPDQKKKLNQYLPLTKQFK